jgi:hypothetical protein
MQQSNEREEFGPFSQFLTGEEGPDSYEKPSQKSVKSSPNPLSREIGTISIHLKDL